MSEDNSPYPCGSMHSARLVKDPIHDFIPLSPFLCAFIDTPHFQRLRSIKQLGTSYYVWIGASHNRFEHCIGVAHLARMMVERLKTAQPELGITERDVRCVELAGLCHDLGHGPWSHVWDSVFIPTVLPNSKWTHEDASEMMFDDLILQNNIDIPQADINFVKDLIKGVVNHSANADPPEKRFLFDIVANKRNGIDVDKFDYIARDVHAVGDRGNFTLTRLINSARVIKNEISYHIKDANQVYELCYTRFSNHKRIYSHKTAKAIEYMVVDALKAADNHMGIGEQIRDPKRYLYLTDDIMPRIEMSTDPELETSRAIFKRIRTRDLYKRVDYKTFAWKWKDFLRDRITPERIVEQAKTLLAEEEGMDIDPLVLESLTSEHVIVNLSTMHYGMQEKNPMDFVTFYSKHNMNDALKASSGDFSSLMPNSFGEVLLQIYTKHPKYFGIIQAGYRSLVRELLPDTAFDHHHMHPITPPESGATNTPILARKSLSSVAGESRNNSFASDASTISPGSTIEDSHLTNPSPASSCRPPPSSPFVNNFTTVPKSFVPKSPSSELKRKKQDMEPLLEMDEDTDEGDANPVLDVDMSEGSAGALTPRANRRSSGRGQGKGNNGRRALPVLDSPVSPSRALRKRKKVEQVQDTIKVPSQKKTRK